MSRPRFIAGAVCPKCGAMDRLQLLEVADDKRRRCVACGHEDGLASASSRAPKTRISGDSQGPTDAATPARPVDPGEGAESDIALPTQSFYSTNFYGKTPA